MSCLPTSDPAFPKVSRAKAVCAMPDCTGSVRARGLCNRHYVADWHRRNPERGKAIVARSNGRRRMSGDAKAYLREWRKNNPDKVRARADRYRAQHKDEINARRRANHAQNADAINARRRAKAAERRSAQLVTPATLR